METKELEVRFDIWCPKCKYHKLEEHWDPCNDCLDYCSNGQSTKPMRFVAASGFEDWVPDEKDIWPEQGEPELPEPPKPTIKNLFNAAGTGYSNGMINYEYDPETYTSKFVSMDTFSQYRSNKIMVLSAEELAGKTLYIDAESTTTSIGTDYDIMAIGLYDSNMGDTLGYLHTWSAKQLTFPEDMSFYKDYGVYFTLRMKGSGSNRVQPGSYVAFTKLIFALEPITEWVPYEKNVKKMMSVRTMVKRPVRASKRSKRVRKTTKGRN